jgi:hypothetical protein
MENCLSLRAAINTAVRANKPFGIQQKPKWGNLKKNSPPNYIMEKTQMKKCHELTETNIPSEGNYKIPRPN